MFSVTKVHASIHPVVLVVPSPFPSFPTSPGHYTHQGDLFAIWPRVGGRARGRQGGVAEVGRKYLVTAPVVVLQGVLWVLLLIIRLEFCLHH